MTSILKTIFATLFFVSFISFAWAFHKSTMQQNNPPVVKIITPVNNSSYTHNTPVHYNISVSDKEDGSSEYDEINAKEVLLQVQYFKQATSANTAMQKAAQADEPGLTALRTSNCFNCHAFDNKVIGPSFNDINKRYMPGAANAAHLEKSIRYGSKDVWGSTSMPTHPELTDAQIKNMVQWIMHNASANGMQYFVGLEGAVPLPANAGTYLLTASYLDHGTGTDSSHRLKSQASVIITVK